MKSLRTSVVLASVVILVVVLFVQSSTPDQTSHQTIIVKCSAASAKGWSFIRIYRPDGTMDKIELDRYINTEVEEANTRKITAALNKLNQEGFEVVSFTETLSTSGTSNTFVLRK